MATFTTRFLGLTGTGGAVCAALLSAPALTAAQAPPSAEASRAVLDRYCVTCHSDRLETAGLSLESVDLADPAGWSAAGGRGRGCEVKPPILVLLLLKEFQILRLHLYLKMM